MSSTPPMRSPRDTVVDRLLLLYILYKTRKKGFSVSGHLKLQKLLYHTQAEMAKEKYKGLNYNFFRWDHGPFDQTIYVDVAHLTQNELISDETESFVGFKVSKKGSALIENYMDVFEDNIETTNFIDRIIERFGGYNASDIKSSTYDFPIVGTKKPMGRAKIGELVLLHMKTEESEKHFKINDDRITNLQVLFDPHFYSAIKTSVARMKTERGKPFRPIIRTPRAP